MSKHYTWHFPLPRTHTGMLLGNGTLGAMVWGEGGVLRVTIGRADFWDHRGGIRWNEQMSYANIKGCLESGNEEGLRQLFGRPAVQEGEPANPSILPIGRYEIDFGADAALTTGKLDLEKGIAHIDVACCGKTFTVAVTLDMTAPVVAVSLPKGCEPVIRPVTAWEYNAEHLQRISFQPPQPVEAKGFSGWVQRRPVDPTLCVGYQHKGRQVIITAVYGDDDEGAIDAAKHTLAQAGDFKEVCKRSRAWWRTYWAGVPSVHIPNERLQFLYDYGMYKFAGLTNPDGVPATLQGPWIEEYQMPPWSSDYHFNINVQMCYWPAYHGNRLEHLPPLFDMVTSWTETLQHNARVFLGIDDGLMLPHAVDDQCTCIGGFWAGSLDHGCTAWVAQMMYRYYRYTMDADFLKEKAYPFMKGAMRVFEGMLERDGDAFVLPVSVSPEYHTKETHAAWGRNASFQLACIHRLGEDLQEAAAALGEEANPAWQEVLDKLPKACLIDDGNGKRIAIWEGIELEESHRHHSHLAGITPFDSIDLTDPEWREIVARSFDRWIYHGTGLWSGWCVPWAAMLHLRFGQGEAAELLLESWQRVYTNEGHGTLHDAHVPGFTLFGPAYTKMVNQETGKERVPNEVMQMDAGMSCTAAIQEMLLHTRRGVNYLFAGAPKRWRKASFGPMRTDGAFLVSAEKDGTAICIKVKSLAGGAFKLANPWGDGPVQVLREGKKHDTVSGAILDIPMKRGEKIEIVSG
ncbi:MAG: glycosyl hydrolase family 95 catalytic domain-containing protein [Armatimonadota bacterium]